jgi:hypothetical protein
MGAVLEFGPAKLRMRMVLVSIADNADDYGFAVLSMETIAAKAVCDVRTAIRTIQALERDGWLTVRRRVLGGKASVYFVNVDRLGVERNAKSRRSPLWAEIERLLTKKKSGVKVSPESVTRPVDSLFLLQTSGDISQGGQVTKPAESGDKTALPILKNRCNHLNPNNTPLPPSKSRGERSEAEAATRNVSEQGSCEEAVDKVMRECDLSDPRLRKVIASAMRAYQAKTDEPADCNATAELMIKQRTMYAREADVLKYTIGVRKFFAHGVWCDMRLWPYDQQRLDQIRRNVGRHL